MLFCLDYLQSCEPFVPLQCVFHSIRFKVNKGWAQRSPFFMPVRGHFFIPSTPRLPACQFAPKAIPLQRF